MVVTEKVPSVFLEPLRVFLDVLADDDVSRSPGEGFWSPRRFQRFGWDI